SQQIKVSMRLRSTLMEYEKLDSQINHLTNQNKKLKKKYMKKCYLMNEYKKEIREQTNREI
ncbi:hypothetical protein RZS08_35000, partial [Arthrospira platensis SPKY1]|nr:hypothetical protein [Arthrospira platensis SPKY1]